MFVWERKLGLVLFSASLALVANAIIIMSDSSLEGIEPTLSFPQGSITAESTPTGNTNSLLARTPVT